MAAFPGARATSEPWRAPLRLGPVAIVLVLLVAIALLSRGIGLSSSGAGDVPQAEVLAQAAASGGPDVSLPDISRTPATAEESELFNAANAVRIEAGLDVLTWDSQLAQVARLRAQQMADEGYFGHVDPRGLSMYTELLERVAYEYGWAGENLARNNFAAETSVSEAMRALMASAGHRANMLATEFTHAAVGATVTSDGMRIYAIIFAGD